MSFARIAVLVILFGGACDEPWEFDDLVDQGMSPQSSEELYADNHVWHVNIQLSDASYDSLRDSPRFYVTGGVRIGDTVLEDVGIRLKGAFSFQGLGGKSSFKIKFNKYVEGQRFVGLEKLTLNNMRQDRSQMHEWLAYQIFRGAEVPAPRSGFARVSVNGENYGLYANVESIDDRFLNDRFAGDEGNLYEAPWGADLDVESVDLYEQDEGQDMSRADLAALVLEVQSPGGSVFFGDDSLLDTEEFLRFVASEAISGHWDGYWKSNNHFLFHEAPIAGAEQGLWRFMPWGLDQSFGQELDPFASRGVLAEKCFSLPTCMAEYTRVGLEVVEAVESLELESSMQPAAELISDYVEEDPRSPHPPAKAARYQAIAKARLEAVPAVMRRHFSCMDDGEERDEDEDGFGACFDDCDDDDEDSRPGAAEVCDGRDNDCDGQVDESLCPCDEVRIGGRDYLFCDVLVPWNAAKNQCEQRGGRLAVFPDRLSTEEAFTKARELDGSRSWYLGATDSAEEGTWLAASGEPTVATFFAPGEPDDFGGEHCAALASFAGGEWEDVRCGTLLPYICELTP
ncbi:MAG: hypothetical protein GY811_22435 [Myxococcales bacterium]|nr:hypothetical protein [Myxococcales bacterium]